MLLFFYDYINFYPQDLVSYFYVIGILNQVNFLLDV